MSRDKRNFILALAIFFMIWLFPACQNTPVAKAPAKIVISKLEVSPNEIGPDEPVNIYAEISNIGGSADNYTVVLYIDDLQREKTIISISSNETETLNWQVIEPTIGEHSVKLDSMTAQFSTSVEKYNIAGLDFHNKGQYEKAILEFNRAIELDPSYAKAYYNRGFSYAKMSQNDAALTDFSTAIKYDPLNAKFYQNRGSFYLWKNQLELAMPDLNKSIEMDPSLSLAYNERSIIYSKQGNDLLCLSDLNKAIELDNNFVMAYRNRAMYYNNKKQWDMAISDLNKVIEISTDPELISEAKQAIQAIQTTR